MKSFAENDVENIFALRQHGLAFAIAPND